MRRLHAAAIAMLCLCLSAQALAQSSNATLGGTVSDSTGALIPGVLLEFHSST
jgi:cobalamin synthase